MTAGPAILDTDILSSLMRNHPVVTLRAREQLFTHRRPTSSLLTRYEILRGLKAKSARRQIRAFDRFCSRVVILPLDEPVVQRAAEIYARLHREGRLIGDADMLIAASALAYGLVLITNNERHFRRVPGLRVHNWMA